MNGIDKNISDLLQPDMVVDITTRGRKTGLPRRIEIWAHYLEGRIFLASRPGRRSWHANLIEHPEFIFHVKEIQKVDILAKANPLFEKYDRYCQFINSIHAQDPVSICQSLQGNLKSQ